MFSQVYFVIQGSNNEGNVAMLETTYREFRDSLKIKYPDGNVPPPDQPPPEFELAEEEEEEGERMDGTHQGDAVPEDDLDIGGPGASLGDKLLQGECD